MTRNISVLLILTALSFFGCSDKNGTTISGQLTNTNGEMVYLEELLPNTTFLLDSTIVEASGKFSFKTRVPEMGFYLLKFGNDRSRVITLLTDSTEELNITGDLNQLLKTYKVEGSEGSAKVADITAFSVGQSMRIDSLSQIFQRAQGGPEFNTVKTQLDMEFQKMVESARKYTVEFIQNNPQSMACIIALYQRIGRTMVFDQSSEQDLPYFEKVSTTLNGVYPQSKHVQTLQLRVENMKAQIAQEKAQQEMEAKLAPGSAAPDITLNNPNGKPVSLASLRGKVVLIGFWASWCRPCRAENPNVVKVYNKYKNKGFEIYAVSLDRTKAAWEKAIQDDNLTWIHVSDLAFWSSPILKVYGVNSIPATVLIDQEGNIIARNLRGELLEKKIAEILG